MKVLLGLALAINVCLGDGVDHQPKGGVIDIGTLGARKTPISKRSKSSRNYEPLACGSQQSLNYGEYVTLQTPGYPYKKYPNNFDCQWELTFPAGAELFLSCDYFWLKNGDYFTLGDNQFYGYSAGFQGWELDFLDGASSLSLGFTSNNRKKAWGFRCYIDVEAGTFNPNVTETTSGPTTTAAPGTCSCGVANTANRIVGGVETETNEYPWQVALVSASGKHPFCGGTLISSRHVLTAAHCTAGSSANSIAVLVGEHRIDDNSFNRISLSAITDHPGYNGNTLDNDFSILTLSEAVAFNREVSPACLPSDVSQDFAGQVATVSGWGTTSSGGNQPTVLNEVDVTVTSNADCNSAYGGSITSNMICAADSGKDSCQGDSGGPLVVKENNRYALAGVVSWGYGCALPQYPGVYARVTAQKDWILANTQGTQDSNC